MLSALVIQFVLTSCSPPFQRKKEVARQKKEALRQQILLMTSKHEADFKWITVLNKSDFYTLELQQALLDPPGRSRMLLASVVDVLKREDGYFLTAHAWMSNIYFQLQCDEKHAQYVMSTSTNDFRIFDEYAIVVSPKSVHKPVAQLAGEIDVDYAYVIHDATDIVVVKGTCIDILFLQDSRLDTEDFLPPDSEGKR